MNGRNFIPKIIFVSLLGVIFLCGSAYSSDRMYEYEGGGGGAVPSPHTNAEVPKCTLYSWWNGKRADHLLTTDPKWSGGGRSTS